MGNMEAQNFNSHIFQATKNLDTHKKHWHRSDEKFNLSLTQKMIPDPPIALIAEIIGGNST